MFSRNRERTTLETAMDRAVSEMASHDVGSDDYNKALESAIKIHTMTVKEKPDSVSLDTIVIAGTQLIGILMVIGHEQIGVSVTVVVDRAGSESQAFVTGRRDARPPAVVPVAPVVRLAAGRRRRAARAGGDDLGGRHDAGLLPERRRAGPAHPEPAAIDARRRLCARQRRAVRAGLRQS